MKKLSITDPEYLISDDVSILHATLKMFLPICESIAGNVSCSNAFNVATMFKWASVAG